MTGADGTAAPATPWRHGRLRAAARPWARPRLLFGRMYEDPAIELAALPAGGRILCVASAGDVAMALARAGREVTAIDVNPAQIAYVERRLRGEPATAGAADRLMGLVRAALRPAGWHRGLVDEFCALDEPAEQVRLWRERLATPAVRRLAALATSPPMLRLAYGRPFVAVTPARLGPAMLDRVEAGLARHPNRDNPWASLLFRGRWPDEPAPGPAGLDLVTGELAAWLEKAPARSFDGFALSNMLDGPGAAYRERLLAAVRRAARPGAVAVLRTLGAPRSPADARRAPTDRTLLWGGITVSTTGALTEALTEALR
jgi:Protein of unknown function (DUF3419)